MECQVCEKTAVISTSNGTFCSEHFKDNFERTTLDTIKKYNLIREGEVIGVANSGGKDSLSLLYIISKHFSKTNRIISITIDEGIKGYRDKTIETMKKYCSEWGVKYKIYSYKDFAGLGMDSIVKVQKGIPCAACGVLRRHLLNAGALESGVDKLCTAHNMDDEAESVLMNVFQNDFEKLVRSGPVSGISSNDGFIPRVKPFIFISEKETMLFSILNGIEALHTACPYSGFGFRGIMARRVKQLETKIPGSKKRLVKAAIRIRVLGSGSTAGRLVKCLMCGSPTPEDVCEACRIKERLSGVIET
jgi:uncharacterized protein (TIGR00269 family)